MRKMSEVLQLRQKELTITVSNMIQQLQALQRKY